MAKEHAPEVKAQVMAALLSGQGVTEVAERYELPTSTVSRWKAKARAEAGRTDDVGELLLDYLTENLRTLRAQSSPSGIRNGCGSRTPPPPRPATES